MDKINWAILGPGTIAGDFAKAISEVNGSIYAVGARSLEKAKNFQVIIMLKRFMEITMKC